MMSGTNTSQISTRFDWRSFVLITLLVLLSGFVWLALSIPLFISQSSISIEAGEVATQDIVAPVPVSFQSEILTEQNRRNAENAVSPVYSPPDTAVARKQVERLRAALTFITNVRADQYSTREQMAADLAVLDDIQLTNDSVDRILSLSNARWQVVEQESIVVLEQVMRNTIRDYQLEDARRSVPALVSLSLPEDQAAIVAELVAAFVAPNSLYREELTEQARQQARESATPVTRSYAIGETIVQRGRVVTESDLEALERAGLMQSRNRWQDYVSTAALTILLTGFTVFYLRTRPELTKDMRNLTLVVILFLIFLFGARISFPGHTVVPYLYPLPAFGLVLAALFGVQYGLTLALPLSILVSYGIPQPFGLTMYFLMSTFLGVLFLGRAVRVTSYIWGGLAIAISGAVTVIAYRLPDPNMDLIGIATLSGAAVLNGIASASIALLLQVFLAQLMGFTTNLQLLDLSRPDQPLLQFILRNAPGTYQHSLQVANLAEQAAESIGGNTLLTRVGALYHDAGKALNPFFFIENQMPGFLNPHDDMDPQEASAAIVKHVTDGLVLARKYRLPRRIQEFISEHHGTLVTRYQYNQAVNAANGDKSKVDIEKFRYPGPNPQSKETALVMLADGCEARVRGERPKTEAELRELIKSTVDDRLANGQLDETDLTTRDLSTIVDSFMGTLYGVYHPRIEYPKLQEKVDTDSTSDLPVDNAQVDESLTQSESASL